MLIRTANVAATLFVAAVAAASPLLERADAKFRDGDLDAAQKLYAASSPATTAAAATGLGNIAFLRGDLDEAVRWLKSANRLAPDDKRAAKLLAQAFYRRNDFAHAAPLYRAIGLDAMAKKLESFHGPAPYRISGAADVVHLSWLQSDPLPVIRARVNGKVDVNLLIDTGGAELLLDPTIGASAGATTFGENKGTFAGGKQSSVQQARVDSVALGGFTIHNVPLQLLDTRRFAAAAGGNLRIDGVLGTVLLAQFIPTLDYRRGELVLRRRTRAQRHATDRAASVGTTLPILFAGDHLILTRGSAGAARPMLFLVDTGLAGGGFLAPDSTLKEAGLVPDGAQVEGVGGGGKLTVTPFTVPDVSLGSIHVKNVAAFAGAFPPSLETSETIRIGGLVSHDFFRNFAVTFDFDRMRMIVER
ncbi:MAG: aspartyl protease family protein [Acidobacteria bacterium]|nr:aspartyl protease family protein [Acidobacteriota bacterium]MBV9476759.1 aspartyl protease family protein [Acidobacteriota bacterium]